MFVDRNIMSLCHLELSDFRNFSRAEVKPQRGINLFCGENGSGKTSLLEAIYYLGLGRSFKTRHTKRVIRHEQPQFLVFGKISSGDTIGIEKNRDGSGRMRLSQEKIQSAAELASALPLQLINPDSHRLIEGGPKARRQFIDWGVFHVKHDAFFPSWQKMRRVLRQRNLALRQAMASKSNSKKKEVGAWDAALVEQAMLLDKLRREYLDKFTPVFMQLLERLLRESEEPGVGEMKLCFYSGWDEKRGLQEELQRALPRDFDLGHTQYGPHRADLKIFVENLPAQDVLSRGQQKMVVCAMSLAQAALLQKATKKCLLLIDDLASELDAKKRGALCALLTNLKTQVFITGTDALLFKGELGGDGRPSVFRVMQKGGQGQILPE